MLRFIILMVMKDILGNTDADYTCERKERALYFENLVKAVMFLKDAVFKRRWGLKHATGSSS